MYSQIIFVVNEEGVNSRIFKIHLSQFVKNYVQRGKVNNSKFFSLISSITNVQADSEGAIIDVMKETLIMKPLNEDENNIKFGLPGLPGSKYSSFKNAMLKTLVSKKTANWKKYQEEKYNLFDTDNYENEDIGKLYSSNLTCIYF